LTETPGYDPHVEWLLLEWQWWRELIDAIPRDAWLAPSILPGWTVFDILGHVVATERFLQGEPITPGEVAAPEDGFANPIAEWNERWLATLRGRPAAELVAMFDAVTSTRRHQLLAMTDDQLNAVGWTPIGDAPYRRFLAIRVFDTYVHEQDVRQTLGLPGHERGPVVAATLDEVERALGWIVGKRAGLPPGSSVRIVLTGPQERIWSILVEERARLVHSVSSPTVTLVLPTPQFLGLACGRIGPEAATSVRIEGDHALADALLGNLAFTI